ncbi:hypothetical protein BGX24_008709, partial [Mortierella sp. AD032]
MVLLRTEHIFAAAHANRPSKKLEPNFVGPFKIIEAFNDNAFKLDYSQPCINTQPSTPICCNFSTHLRHVSRMDPPRPPPLPIDDNEEYEVDDILDYKVVQGSPRWPVKWKGYPLDHASCEPKLEMQLRKARLAADLKQFGKELTGYVNCRGVAFRRARESIDKLRGDFLKLTPSILDLQLQDDTVVSLKFEQGSENISTIGLEVLKPSAIRLMKMPVVTSVAFLPKNTLFQSSGLINSAIDEHAVLKVIEVVYLPDGGSAVLHKMQQAIHDYCSGRNSEKNRAWDGIYSGTTVSLPESIEASSKFMELETLHKHSVLLGMELMVALTEGEDPNSETTGETSREALSETEASFEPNQDGSNSAELHVGDFDLSK